LDSKNDISLENPHLAKRFLRILGTGFNWLRETSCLSTGQVGLKSNHSEMHPKQKACSQPGAFSEEPIFELLSR